VLQAEAFRTEPFVVGPLSEDLASLVVHLDGDDTSILKQSARIAFDKGLEDPGVINDKMA